MKRTNKIISILLATILILSTFSISVVNAADETITFSAQTDVFMLTGRNCAVISAQFS